jgi:mannose-6-phosphate isomerase-like protein (cupin superfamily)
MFAFIANAVHRPRTATLEPCVVAPGAAIDRGEYPVVRMRAAEDTVLRVTTGVVELVAGGRRRRLAAGEEAIVPARVPYRLVSTGDGEARVQREYRAV